MCDRLPNCRSHFVQQLDIAHQLTYCSPGFGLPCEEDLVHVPRAGGRAGFMKPGEVSSGKPLGCSKTQRFKFVGSALGVLERSIELSQQPHQSGCPEGSDR